MFIKGWQITNYESSFYESQESGWSLTLGPKNTFLTLISHLLDGQGCLGIDEEVEVVLRCHEVKRVKVTMWLAIYGMLTYLGWVSTTLWIFKNVLILTRLDFDLDGGEWWCLGAEHRMKWTTGQPSPESLIALGNSSIINQDINPQCLMLNQDFMGNEVIIHHC